MARVPRMIVFDLDACVWFPEMYMLMGGGGAPFETAARNVATDRHGEAVKLLGAIPQIFEALRAEPRFAGCQVAIASRKRRRPRGRALSSTRSRPRPTPTARRASSRACSRRRACGFTRARRRRTSPRSAREAVPFGAFVAPRR